VNGALWLIDIERLVLRDPTFTAERAERIRLALHAEFRRRVSPDVEGREISLESVEVAGIDLRPSDDDQTIARRLAQAILQGTGLTEEAPRG